MPQYNPASDIAIKMKGTAGGGSNNNIVIFSGSYVPTSAMGYTIDISSAGFTAITNISAIAIKNTTDPLQVPNIAVSSFTTTSVVLNITQGNNATVVILGINVLSGAPLVAAVLTGLSVHLRVEGY